MNLILKAQQEILGSLVRDLTQVFPRSKSEVKRRITAHTTRILKAVLEGAYTGGFDDALSAVEAPILEAIKELEGR